MTKRVPGSRFGHEVGMTQQTMQADLISRGDGWERGVRSVLLANDRVSTEVVIDRALDLAGARIDGIPIGWRSPVPIVGPWHLEREGLGPHRGMFGGLLTTGGIDHFGHPARVSDGRYGDETTPRNYPMHGRLSSSPAKLDGYGITRQEHPVAWVAGTVHQVTLFGEDLVLERRISLPFGSTTISVRDRVTNQGFAPSPLAMLYHVNAGWPTASPGAFITMTGALVRGDEHLAELMPPTRGSKHTTRAFSMEGPRATASALSTYRGAAIGMRVHWDTAALPSAVEWRLTEGAGRYAIGIEPITRRYTPNGPVLPELAPGGTAELGVDIELVHG
jgi:hypothetical protein